MSAYIGCRTGHRHEYVIPDRWRQRWRAEGGRILRPADADLAAACGPRPERIDAVRSRIRTSEPEPAPTPPAPGPTEPAPESAAPEPEPGTPPAPAEISDASLLARADAGEKMAALARELGVSKSTISRRLKKIREDLAQ